MSDKNQGEGNREAARNYNEATRDFVKSGQVDEQARDAAEIDKTEKIDLEKAEQEGRSRAKEEDPAVKRDS